VRACVRAREIGVANLAIDKRANRARESFLRERSELRALRRERTII